MTEQEPYPAAILQFEADWLNRTHDGRYEQAVRDRFGCCESGGIGG